MIFFLCHTHTHFTLWNSVLSCYAVYVQQYKFIPNTRSTPAGETPTQWDTMKLHEFSGTKQTVVIYQNILCSYYLFYFFLHFSLPFSDSVGFCVCALTHFFSQNNSRDKMIYDGYRRQPNKIILQWRKGRKMNGKKYEKRRERKNNFIFSLTAQLIDKKTVSSSFHLTNFCCGKYEKNNEWWHLIGWLQYTHFPQHRATECVFVGRDWLLYTHSTPISNALPPINQSFDETCTEN